MNFTEKYSFLFSENARYKKFVRIVICNDDKSVWVDIRLFYDDKPTTRGVMLTKDEFLDLVENICALYTGKVNEGYIPRVQNQHVTNRFVYLTRANAFLYSITLAKKNDEKEIRISFKELENLFNNFDEITHEIFKL
jgi:hypothetical protein